MPRTITQECAWTIVRQFAGDVGKQLDDDVLAVVLIGSLATGAYLPGRSDIDTAVVIRDDAAVEVARSTRALAEHYRMLYHIPKDFGAVVIRERELIAPFDPERGLASEVLRLKQQGMVLWGEYNLRALPAPSAADIRAEVQVFYPWLRANYIDQRPEAERTADSVVNTILYELRLFIWDRHGEYSFDKRAVIPRFLNLAGTEAYREILAPLDSYLRADQALDDVNALEAMLREISHFVRHAVPWSVAT